jgi:urease accessory protein
MLRASTLLGRREEARYAGRTIDAVPVTWDEATKRRLRRTSLAGVDVAIDVPRGTYLADGAVLDDDGARIIVVERTAASALVVDLPAAAPPGELIRAAARIGHAFGNQHVPLDVEGTSIRIPLTTSEAVARATVASLGIAGLDVRVDDVVLARAAPMTSGHRHDEDDHAHPHG